jgi:hypothetical protein
MPVFEVLIFVLAILFILVWALIINPPSSWIGRKKSDGDQTKTLR